MLLVSRAVLKLFCILYHARVKQTTSFQNLNLQFSQSLPKLFHTGGKAQHLVYSLLKNDNTSCFKLFFFYEQMGNKNITQIHNNFNVIFQIHNKITYCHQTIPASFLTCQFKKKPEKLLKKFFIGSLWVLCILYLLFQINSFKAKYRLIFKFSKKATKSNNSYIYTYF